MSDNVQAKYEFTVLFMHEFKLFLSCVSGFILSTVIQVDGRRYRHIPRLLKEGSICGRVYI